MLKYCEPVLQKAEEVAASGSQLDVLRVLRKLPFGDYCDFYLNPPTDYPKTKALVPELPSDEVQKRWMGHFGRDMMVQSANITRLLVNLYVDVVGEPLGGKRILDYGCGWGRLLRTMYHVEDPANVFGIDPMTDSIDACAQHKIIHNVEVCDVLPESLPFGTIKFDLMFSFSVFTHLSERAMHAVLRAARKRVAERGVYVITIRPVEFWQIRKAVWGGGLVNDLEAEHASKGFAYYCPKAVDTKLAEDYGDSSMSFDYLKNLAAETGWRVARVDRDLIQPLQTFVALSPF